jgi:uncharacterized repeat protein (TIGR03803 family)
MTNRRQHTASTALLRLRASIGVLSLMVMVVLVPTVLTAQAQTYHILHTFTGGSDGGYAYTGLIRDSKGSLYGTTCGTCGQGFGTVYRIDKNGKVVLYNFTGGDDGESPGGLTQDAAGNFYGTTYWGGAHGVGTVFKLDTTGTLTVLHTFTGANGSTPSGSAPLIWDTEGNLYGTTTLGGADNLGTVFILNPVTKKFRVLHSFAGGTDGASPWAGLIRDSAGNLYGTTAGGGDYNCSSNGCGVVFKLSRSGDVTVLHTFIGAEGGNPYSTLIRDQSGNLYGSTLYGGAHGAGVVFKLDPLGTLTVLHDFTGADGSGPGSLTMDPSGNFYGTTAWGGAHSYGTVFKLDFNGTETVLHHFHGADGNYPSSNSLVRNAAGTLYGTTGWGGTSGIGVIFAQKP